MHRAKAYVIIFMCGLYAAMYAAHYVGLFMHQEIPGPDLAFHLMFYSFIGLGVFELSLTSLKLFRAAVTGDTKEMKEIIVDMETGSYPKFVDPPVDAQIVTEVKEKNG